MCRCTTLWNILRLSDYQVHDWMIWGWLPCYDRHWADMSRDSGSTTGERARHDKGELQHQLQRQHRSEYRLPLVGRWSMGKCRRFYQQWHGRYRTDRDDDAVSRRPVRPVWDSVLWRLGGIVRAVCSSTTLPTYMEFIRCASCHRLSRLITTNINCSLLTPR